MTYQNPWSGSVHSLPKYSQLEAIASQETPAQIVEWESSPEFPALCDERAREIKSNLTASKKDEPLFITAILPERQGIVSVLSRIGAPQRSALFFTSDFRAAHYTDLLLTGIDLTAAEFNASDFVGALRELESVGTRNFVLDRCPRCWSFPVTSAATITSAELAIDHWVSVKAAQQVRADAYFKLAEHRAASSDFAGSRDVALLAIAHIAPEDPRFHAHLLKMADHLNDDGLKSEAKSAMGKGKPLSRLASFLGHFEWRSVGSALKT